MGIAVQVKTLAECLQRHDNQGAVQLRLAGVENAGDSQGQCGNAALLTGTG